MASTAQLNDWLNKPITPTGWTRLNQLYCEVADETTTEAAFTAMSLVGKLSLIKDCSPKYQLAVIGALIKRMVALGEESDRLVACSRRGSYKWLIVEKELA